MTAAQIIALVFELAMRAGPAGVISDLKNAYDVFTSETDPTPEQQEAIDAAYAAASALLDADIAEKEAEV